MPTRAALELIDFDIPPQYFIEDGVRPTEYHFEVVYRDEGIVIQNVYNENETITIPYINAESLHATVERMQAGLNELILNLCALEPMVWQRILEP